STKTQQPALALAGRWRTDGSKDHTPGSFTFGCRKIGAIAKCLDLGYKPWLDCRANAVARGGVGVNCITQTLDEYHQACVRMMRADFCGNGKSWTIDGHALNVYDSIYINHSDREAYPQYNWWFEGEWGPNGPTCVMDYTDP